MTIHTHKKLTSEHIKYARRSQLAKLLDTTPETISRWNRRGFKTTLISICNPCIDREVLITGLIKRREEFVRVENSRKEFDLIFDAVLNAEKQPA